MNYIIHSSINSKGKIKKAISAIKFNGTRKI